MELKWHQKDVEKKQSSANPLRASHRWAPLVGYQLPSRRRETWPVTWRPLVEVCRRGCLPLGSLAYVLHTWGHVYFHHSKQLKSNLKNV